MELPHVLRFTFHGYVMSNFWKRGDPLIWLSGSALLLLFLMITGILLLILSKGLGFFWPRGLVQLKLADGRRVIGEIHQREPIPLASERKAGQPTPYRIQLKVGNRDVYGQDFRWVPEAEIRERTFPKNLAGMERLEYGNMYGRVSQFRRGETVVEVGENDILPHTKPLRHAIREAHRLRKRIERLEAEFARIRQPITELEAQLEKAGPNQVDAIKLTLEQRQSELQPRLNPKEAELERLRSARESNRLLVTIADGTQKELLTEQIVRIYWPNANGWFGKVQIYVSRLWEFLTAEPREANMEGGIFPAIFGTVMMVLLMTIIVVPMGVLVAVYLHEYAKEGPFVRAVRIAMNNLAGVPSIVFGMFGLGFFIYFVGGGIDRAFFSERLPAPTFGTGGILWASLTLSLLTLPVVVVSTEEALAAVPRANREGALSLAATKLQMLWHIVIPNAMPGILTGMILAVSRGAGEVAPLMITGAVKLAPNLPFDGTWPFVHLERKFMHLGFHIFDVGFQSPNVEAAKPMVYMTALLLILLVLGLNLVAMVIRNRLRQRYRGARL